MSYFRTLSQSYYCWWGGGTGVGGGEGERIKSYLAGDVVLALVFTGCDFLSLQGKCGRKPCDELCISYSRRSVFVVLRGSRVENRVVYFILTCVCVLFQTMSGSSRAARCSTGRCTWTKKGIPFTWGLCKLCLLHNVQSYFCFTFLQISKVYFKFCFRLSVIVCFKGELYMLLRKHIL